MPPMVYQIRVRGHLPPGWAAEFPELKLECEPSGLTSLTGPVPDQAALYGLLVHIRDLGLTLISLNPLEPKSQGKQP